MTEPNTEAGRDLLQWYAPRENAPNDMYREPFLLAILRIEAEAAGSLAALREALAGLLWLVENNPNTTVRQIIDTEPVAAARAALAAEPKP